MNTCDQWVWDASARYLAALRSKNPAAAISAQESLREAVEQARVSEARLAATQAATC